MNAWGELADKGSRVGSDHQKRKPAGATPLMGRR